MGEIGAIIIISRELFPDIPAPERKYLHAGRAWYLFPYNHDVIEKGPEVSGQKANVLGIVQPSIRSTLGV